MWNRSIFLASLSEYPSVLQGGRCLSCQFRNTTTPALLRPRSTLRYYASTSNDKKNNRPVPSTPTPPKNLNFKQNTPPSDPDNQDEKEIVPRALDRPIGSMIPPQEGQNTGVDKRTWGERRDDFVNHEKHVERRKNLTTQIAKPYFRDWSNMRYHEGKTFLSNPRLFKRDKALYFPNMYGITLASPSTPRNTTSILRGRISVVNLFSNVWAENQVLSFVGMAQNPGLHEILKGNSAVQKVDVNLEENRFKALLVRMFMWQTRKRLAATQHERYFLVRRGITETIRHTIGVMNSKVGYVYLLDENCRIRWAGSGPASEGEVGSLNNGIQRLLEERKILQHGDMANSTGEDLEERKRRAVEGSLRTL